MPPPTLPAMLEHLRTLPRIYGSDTFSTVYLGKDRVFRLVRSEGLTVLNRFLESKLLPKLESYGVVPTHVAEHVQLNGRSHAILEHPRVPFVTHPGEWTASMMRDAAEYLLDLNIRLDEHGLMIKDGHLLNVTFHRGKPVFLDFGSLTFQTPDLRQRWLDEFRCRIWLPVWIAARGYTDLASGMVKTEPRGLGYMLGYTRLGSKLPFASRRAKRLMLEKGWRAALEFVRSIVSKYKIALPDSLWTRYSERFPEEKARKIDVIVNHAGGCAPGSIHELAANAGTIGERLASELNVPVCATDVDPSCVEAAYARTKGKNLHFYPAVLNLLFPVPPYGAGSCRPGSVERLKADLVLATALVHHLVATPQVSMSTFVQIVSDYCRQSAIIEWVDPSDKFLVQWAASGVRIPADYNLNSFLEACAEHFPHCTPLPEYHATRRLFEFRR